jgi:hypothetical protein
MQISVWTFEKDVKNTEINLSEIRCDNGKSKTQFQHLPKRNDENHEFCSVGYPVSEPISGTS